jgi:hypothetical protein
MPPKTIESALEATLQPKEDKNINIRDILNKLFDLQEIEQKSILSECHVNAILKMRATNTYLAKNYGFTITLYDGLIDDKLQYIISKDARGRNDIIKVLEAMRDMPLPLEEKKGWFR